MQASSPNILPNKDFLETIQNTPLVSIDIIVRNSRGEVLLGLRNNQPAKDFWFVPGGRILKNEKIKDAFERIALNELSANIKFEEAALVGVFDHFYPDNTFGSDNISTHCVSVAYELKLSENRPIHPDAQHRDYQWFKIDILLANPAVHENTQLFFRNHC